MGDPVLSVFPPKRFQEAIKGGLDGKVKVYFSKLIRVGVQM